MARHKTPRRSRRAVRRNQRSARAATARETEDLERELGAAAEIQASLLPPKIPQLPGYDIYAYYRSAKRVSGDYYDFIPVDHERLGIAVADVSGKGIPGAMIMACTRTLLRMLAPQCGTPSETLRRTNVQITRDVRRGVFVTAMLAFLTVRTREMTVCSAGHNPMVVCRGRARPCELVNPGGIAVGIDDGPVFDRTLQEIRIRIDPGDRIVMFTDGVVEAMNGELEQYSEERFYGLVARCQDLPSKDLLRTIVRDVDAHAGDAEQHDDITMVTLRASP